MWTIPLQLTYTASAVALGDYALNDLFADRVRNPGGYEDEYTQYQPEDEAVQQSDELWTAPVIIITILMCPYTLT